VLLIDYDERIRSTAVEMLNHLGIDVVTAESGEEAVTFLIQAGTSNRPEH
jgi:CheY-like chemotaxis protein